MSEQETCKAVSAGRGSWEGLPDLCSPKDISRFTGVSVGTIRREITEGRLSGCRVGRRLFVAKKSLAEYLGMRQA